MVAGVGDLAFGNLFYPDALSRNWRSSILRSTEAVAPPRSSAKAHNPYFRVSGRLLQRVAKLFPVCFAAGINRDVLVTQLRQALRGNVRVFTRFAGAIHDHGRLTIRNDRGSATIHILKRQMSRAGNVSRTIVFLKKSWLTFRAQPRRSSDTEGLSFGDLSLRRVSKNRTRIPCRLLAQG